MAWAIPIAVEVVKQLATPPKAGPTGQAVKIDTTPTTLQFAKPTVGSALADTGNPTLLSNTGADTEHGFGFKPMGMPEDAGQKLPPMQSIASGDLALGERPPVAEGLNSRTLAVGDAGLAGSQGVAGSPVVTPVGQAAGTKIEAGGGAPDTESGGGNAVGWAQMAAGLGSAIADANQVRPGPIGGLIHGSPSMETTLPDIRQRLMAYLARMGR